MDSAERRAMDAAEALIARRDRSVAEVRRHLEGRRVPPAVAEQVIERLVALGYLDDEAMARRFAEQRRERDGWGRDRIVRRLRSLGVAEDAVRAAVEGQDDGAELETAVRLLERKVRRPLDDRARRRALGLLARRGYDEQLALAALGRYERAA